MIVQFVGNTYGVVFVGGFTATNKLYGVLEVGASPYGVAMDTYGGPDLGARSERRCR